MTHDETLDALLHCYAYAETLRLSKNGAYKNYIFRNIALSHNPDLSDWNIEFLKNRLFDDGFLKEAPYGDAEPYILTPEGIKAAQRGHYTKSTKKAEMEDEIDALTVRSLKDSRRALVISIVAFLVPTLISIYPLLKDEDNPHQIEKLKKQVDQLQLEVEKIKKNVKLIQ